MKWLIEKQLTGDPDLNFDPAHGAVKAPWLAWGPYLWADGQKARSDGLTYDLTDLRPDDGTHPATPGAQEGGPDAARLCQERLDGADLVSRRETVNGSDRRLSDLNTRVRPQVDGAATKDRVTRD